MGKKVIGVILMVVGVFIALVLFTYGGPILPHIIGPVVFVSLGAFLLWFKRKEKHAS
jgi:hypothetical protein